MELRPGAETGIHQPQIRQPLQGGLIQRRPPALVIGSVRPAGAGTLIPIKAQPAEVCLHLIGIPPGTAGSVQILHSQDHPAAPLPGAEPRQQTAEDVAQVNPPAGRGGEPPPDRAGVLHRPLPSPILYFLL